MAALSIQLLQLILLSCMHLAMRHDAVHACSLGLHPDCLSALLALPALQALDLYGLAHLTDDIGPTLAQLAQLRALNLGNTGCGDNLVKALTHRLEMDAWARSTGACLHAFLPCNMPACNV